MYMFNHSEIIRHPLHQVEYSIIDSCNRSCRSCSHFVPLASNPNAVSLKEFIKNTELLHKVIPDVHTFWLIGGEPTLHPGYTEILKELRRIYDNIPIGIMSNGYGVIRKRDDESFWNFIRENEIVWRITTYDVSPEVYIKLFKKQHCLDLLSLDINNRFSNLAVLTEKTQEITAEKYRICGWERLNIFVRNNKIWKCPSVEYIDLFNQYFGKQFIIEPDDYLEIDEGLTRNEIIEFKNRPSSFCKNCDISKRFNQYFPVKKSEKKITEWMAE